MQSHHQTKQIQITDHHVLELQHLVVHSEEWRPKLDGMLFALPKIHEASMGYGTISSTQDVDGIIRRTPLVENFDDRLYPAFSLDILRVGW